MLKGSALILCGVLAGWFLPRLLISLIAERIVLREFRKVHFPIHTLNTHHLRAFLGSVEPMLRPFLTQKSLARMLEGIRSQHPIMIEAAVRGVRNESEVIAYLADMGLLSEMNLSYEEARERIGTVETARRRHEPKSDHARFYPGQAPSPPLRLPAEHEPVGGVIVSFPLFYPRGWKAHAVLIQEIAAMAEAFVIVRNEHWQKAVELFLIQSGLKLDSISFFHFFTDEVWTRDYGPTTVFSGEEEEPVFIWNPYCIAGQAYYKFDADLTAALAMALDVPVFRLPLIVEGGNLITDGQGTIIMSGSVFETNPEVDGASLEKILADYFGCQRLITLPALKGEITGHIDMVVKFVDGDTLMVARACKGHKWHEDLENVARILARMQSAHGGHYSIVRIPMPRRSTSSHCFWSYVNSLTLNRKVIVPVFNVPEDDHALEIYRSIMPTHEVVGIDFSSYPVGSVHCQSKELPKKVWA